MWIENEKQCFKMFRKKSALAAFSPWICSSCSVQSISCEPNHAISRPLCVLDFRFILSFFICDLLIYWKKKIACTINVFYSLVLQCTRYSYKYYQNSQVSQPDFAFKKIVLWQFTSHYFIVPSAARHVCFDHASGERKKEKKQYVPIALSIPYDFNDMLNEKPFDMAKIIDHSK